MVVVRTSVNFRCVSIKLSLSHVYYCKGNVLITLKSIIISTVVPRYGLVSNACTNKITLSPTLQMSTIGNGYVSSFLLHSGSECMCYASPTLLPRSLPPTFCDFTLSLFTINSIRYIQSQSTPFL